MERVVDLCKGATQYPHNFAGDRDSPEFSLLSYRAQLTSHQRRLFSTEAQSSVNFLELNDGGIGTTFYMERPLLETKRPGISADSERLLEHYRKQRWEIEYSSWYCVCHHNEGRPSM